MIKSNMIPERNYKCIIKRNNSEPSNNEESAKELLKNPMNKRSLTVEKKSMTNKSCLVPKRHASNIEDKIENIKKMIKIKKNSQCINYSNTECYKFICSKHRSRNHSNTELRRHKDTIYNLIKHLPKMPTIVNAFKSYKNIATTSNEKRKINLIIKKNFKTKPIIKIVPKNVQMILRLPEVKELQKTFFKM